MKLPPVDFIKRQMHARPLACFSAAFLAGLIFAHARSVSLPFLLAFCAVSVVACIIAALNRRNISAFMLLIALSLGMACMNLDVLPTMATEDRYSVNMTGKVTSQPYIKADTGRLIFQFDIDTVDGAREDSIVRMYLRSDDPAPLQAIEYGQNLSVTGHIWAPDPATNPSEFDFGIYLSENGMNAYATAKIEDVSILSENRDARSALFDLRSRIAAQIEALFPGNAPIIQALVLADRTQLSDDIRDSFQETGITHLICISGMHVSVLAMVMLFFLKRVMSQRSAIAITFALLLLYGVLIGFTSSYVRALIMFMIFSCAPIAGYPSDGITRLSTALLLTLLMAPRQIADAGFVLSYSATAGIILLYPPLLDLFGLKDSLRRKPCTNAVFRLIRRAIFYFPKLLCATLSAQLATLPAVIAFFGVQSLVSVPANLLCVPLCMLAYPVSLIALIVSFISMPLGMAIAAIPEVLLSLMSRIALYSAQLPVTGIRIGKYPALLILLHGCIILAASELSRIRPAIRRFIPLALVLTAALASLNTWAQGLGFSIAFLDADQADCAVIRTEGRTYLVDVGDTYTPIGDYLDAKCLSLDGIFLSHPDQDHSGGLTDVLNTMKPRALYIPAGWYDMEDISDAVLEGMALAESMGVEIVEVSTGDIIPLSSNTTAQVYGPEPSLNTRDSNAISMVLSISHRGHATLFTGDLPVKHEPAALPDTEILKVAHHGSSESTSQAFLDATAPEIAIISVGENNFGHPSGEVVERLKAANARILRTDECGAITLRLNKDDQWRIETYLPMEE